jgi:hypothetical protein
MTAGIAAANVLATPPDVAAANPSARDVDLTASITIPIVDIDTPGPISISRLLSLTLEALPNSLRAILDSEAGTVYNLPGLHTDFSSSGQQTFSAIRNPGETLGFGFTSQGPENNSWDILNGFATGDSNIDQGRTLGLELLTGGSRGIGAALGGVLSTASVDRQITVLNSGLATNFTRTILDGRGEIAATPFDGARVVGGGNLINTAGGTDFNLGSLRAGGDFGGALGGSAGLCLGSNQASKCAGDLAFATFGAPQQSLKGGLYFGDPATDDLSFNIPTNLAVKVGHGRLAVTGDLGGTVKVGSVEIGRVIPINIQIPGASSMLSSSSTRQQQSVRDSFRAVPRKLPSDNDTGGKHRAPLRDAVANIKAAVDNAVGGKHAAKDAED